MKTKSILMLLAVVWLGMASLPVSGKTTAEDRGAYVIKKAGIGKAKVSQFRASFLAYQKELKAAESGYDNLKDELKPAIKDRRITEAQATNLLNLKWDSDARELAVKKKYTALFRKFLTARETYAVFTYANDSKEKITGKE